MKKELLITQILDSKQMAELIDIFNKQVRPKRKRRVNEDSKTTKD